MPQGAAAARALPKPKPVREAAAESRPSRLPSITAASGSARRHPRRSWCAPPPPPPGQRPSRPPGPRRRSPPPIFNADYLDNPPPPYPALSRRVGEQGRVVLRVLVNPAGSADEVQVRSSSGHRAARRGGARDGARAGVRPGAARRRAGRRRGCWSRSLSDWKADPMEPTQASASPTFLAQTDAVGKAILAFLLVMSVATWYLIVTKALSAADRAAAQRALPGDASGTRRRSARCSATSRSSHPDEPFSHLAWHAIVASRHHQRHGANRLDEAGSAAEFLTRAMRRVIDEDTARLESGLTVLASVGSTAPFVGLFGTVWGVYHALVAIGMSRPGHARQGGRPGGRGADHDRARPRGRDSGGARLQRLRARATAWCSRGWTPSRTTSSRCSPPARTSATPAPWCR